MVGAVARHAPKTLTGPLGGIGHPIPVKGNEKSILGSVSSKVVIPLRAGEEQHETVRVLDVQPRRGGASAVN